MLSAQAQSQALLSRTIPRRILRIQNDDMFDRPSTLSIRLADRLQRVRLFAVLLQHLGKALFLFRIEDLEDTAVAIGKNIVIVPREVVKD